VVLVPSREAILGWRHEFKIKPARMNLHYCELEIVNLKNR